MRDLEEMQHAELSADGAEVIVSGRYIRDLEKTYKRPIRGL